MSAREGARRARETARPLGAGIAEIYAIGREMVAIPAGIWMRVAERLGEWILAAAAFAWPYLLAGVELGRRALDWAAREVTPARALAAVTLIASVLLCVSQFLDYREVRAGVPAYAEVEQVAPPPQVEGSARNAGAPHAYVLLAVGLASAALVALSMTGRWRLARLLVPLGLLTVAVAALIDAPAGLDEGATAVEFEGAEARLLGPFWVELTAGAVIACCGLLLTLALRPGAAPRRGARNAARRRSRPPLEGSRVQGARP